MLIFFSSFVTLLTDWWWFSEVGQTDIFATSLKAKIALGAGTGIFSAAFLLANLFFAVRGKVPWIVAIPETLVGQPLSLNNQMAKKLGIAVSVVIGSLIGLIAAGSWQDVVRFLSASPFGQTDPIFGHDIAFYVFSLPVYELGLGLVRFLTLTSLFMIGAMYLFRGSLNLSALFEKFALSSLSEKLGGPPITLASHRDTDTKAMLHIGILLSVFLASLAAGSRLSVYRLLIAQNGPVFGAAFTDVTVMIPLLNISALVYGLAALLALFYGVRGSAKPLLVAISLNVLAGFATAVIPPVFQKLIVSPNELVKETPFIRHNIDATRKAYGLDAIEEREIAADEPLDAADIAANNLTIKNVRLWDRAPLLSTFSQIQEIRTYYEFNSVDNDRYTIDGEVRQIMLSPRELSTENLPNRSWINERLTFTHGYGVAAGPVNLVTPEGLPVLFVKDLPPNSTAPELTVERPEVYFGELTNDYVIVKTKSKEFDYPKGDENVYTTYMGQAGVEISSFLRRLIFALRFSSLKLLLSGDITSESRIVYNRNIKERVAKAAPFLTYDRDPYILISEGKLYWIIDAYTSTDKYPYSQPLTLNGRSVNYIRNPVKVVVDAYDGTMTFYLADPQDPIIKTFVEIFPKTFRSLSDMPKNLIAHLRYPEDIFTLQTAVYATYHMDEAQIFYNKEDLWEIPAIAQEGEQSTAGKVPAMTPRHMIMKLPGEKIEEFILMLPFTPRSKDNLSAWMVARNDREHYGKLVVYRFPKDKLVYGPKQVIGRINQDADISREISLWDQRGSQVIQGPLLVIPIEESLVYIRPLYLKAEDGKIPELKRVIVAYENKIAMEETLEAGLARIFGAGQTTPRTTQEAITSAVPEDVAVDDRIRQAAETYESAIRAQREGDWGRYGEEMKKLGDILYRLRQ